MGLDRSEREGSGRRWGPSRHAGSGAAGLAGKGESKGAGRVWVATSTASAHDCDAKGRQDSSKGGGKSATFQSKGAQSSGYGYSSKGKETDAKGKGGKQGGYGWKGKGQAQELDADSLQLSALASFASAGGELVDVGVNWGKLLLRDGPSEQKDIAAQLCRARAANVPCIMLTGTEVGNARAAEKMCRVGVEIIRSLLQESSVADGSIPSLRFTAGVHPNHLGSTRKDTMDALRTLAASPFCVAVGECGLDYERMGSPREEQIQWCRSQVSLAVELGKPLFLHERERDKGPPLGAAKDLWQILEEYKVNPSQACIHCFTGSAQQLQEYVRKGYVIGLTGFIGMQRRAAHLRRALQEGILPLSQLVLETDSPYMMPDANYIPGSIGMQLRRMEPAAMPAVCQAVAECMGISAAEVAQATTANAKRLFNLP